LNEEIFNISEELAKSFTFERNKNILGKAKEAEHRKNVLLKKIKDSIDSNPSVRLLRRNARIMNQTPPQNEPFSAPITNTQGFR